MKYVSDHDGAIHLIGSKGVGAVRFRVGDMILGRYKVTGELGEGGMGVVYRCCDIVSGVTVAVKGLPPEVSHNSDEMESIRENYQLVRTLRHPHIAAVTNLEQDAIGDYYLVMDIAAGENLCRWQRHHPMATREMKLAILHQIASALDYAHMKNIVHRDVKPANVMVDEHGQVVVLDFGLAAEIHSSWTRTSQLVTSRSGTPQYQAPEQWLGRPQGKETDVYSLAVLAFQLFFDQLPFNASDPVVLGHAVLHAPVPKMNNVQSFVNAAFAKAMAKSPDKRFHSCSEFVDALKGRDGGGVTGTIPKWVVPVVLIAVILGVAWISVMLVNGKIGMGVNPGYQHVLSHIAQGYEDAKKVGVDQSTNGKLDTEVVGGAVRERISVNTLMNGNPQNRKRCGVSGGFPSLSDEELQQLSSSGEDVIRNRNMSHSKPVRGQQSRVRSRVSNSYKGMEAFPNLSDEELEELAYPTKTDAGYDGFSSLSEEELRQIILSAEEVRSKNGRK